MMRPTYNFEPRYRVTTLTREDWTTGTGTRPSVKGHIWFTDGSRMRGWGTGAGVYGQPVRRRLSLPLGRYATVFQAEVFANLACAHDIKNHGTPEKHVTALIVWRPWRLSGLSEKHPHWFANVRRRWMISPSGMLWDFIGSPAMQGWEAMKQLTHSGGVTQPVGL
jgi:hypothetical protein